MSATTRLSFILTALTVSVLITAGATGAAGSLPPSQLQCEYMTNPMGMDVAKPRFYWAPAHTSRGARQSSYQILVSGNPEVKTGDEWDSGQVQSAEFVHIVYQGRKLESGKTYYWKVRYWDQDGAPSPFSQIARFDTGLLPASDWKAQWIRGANVFRKEFSLKAKPVRARAYVTGLGYYELRLNGKKVDDHLLDPGWTEFSKRILYATYDVTGELRAGANAVGLMVGEGWFKARASLLQLDVELPGGEKVLILSDGTWKTAEGPIESDSIYNGETYDARKEMPGWDLPGFDDSRWKPVSLNDPPKGILSAQMMPPIRAVADIVPLVMTNPQPGVFVFDMGQNISGWVRLQVKGPAGTAVRMRHAELLYENGTLNVENLRTARATDTYILRGDPKGELFEPHFTYHGFRYVELTGFPGTPKLDTVLGRVVHSDVTPTGGFSASKPILNQIQRIVLWGTKTNLHSIPTDCDQRNERLGWLADAHLAAETAMLNYDMAAFYTNFLRSIRDSQDPDGAVGDTVPRNGRKGAGDPAWGSAYPILVLYMYQQYGDTRILEEHFDGIRAWADYLRSQSKDGIFSSSKYGDWVPVEPTPGNLVSTAYYYWSTEIVAKAAAVLGRNAEAERYGALARDIAKAFHEKFYDPEKRYYLPGTQTANTLPLYLRIAPEDLRPNVRNRITDDVVYFKNTHLTTGILGAKYILLVLTELGRADLAYDLATQITYPSWGYMVENGATTLWELWQNRTGPSMNSHNHPMLGSIGAWFYTALAGINVRQEGAGYRSIRIEPQIVRDLQYASGTLETVRGTVISSWSRAGSSLRMEVTVPVGSSAEVVIPKLNLRNVSVEEGGKPVWQDGAFRPGVSGVNTARETSNAVIVEIGSGSYVFERKGD